jgi:tRNA threonylcarbamoyladenosine biosynthesis protein TsaE
VNSAAPTWLPLADEAATEQLGARLARALPLDAEPFVLYLQGELGAGKTTLARGVLRALGERGAVRSPTYALIAEYFPGDARVLHLDLYRLKSPRELQALGLADYLSGSRLWLVEWPERAGDEGLPRPDARLRLEPHDQARRAWLEPVTARGAQWLSRAADSG